MSGWDLLPVEFGLPITISAFMHRISGHEQSTSSVPVIREVVPVVACVQLLLGDNMLTHVGCDARLCVVEKSLRLLNNSFIRNRVPRIVGFMGQSSHGDPHLNGILGMNNACPKGKEPAQLIRMAAFRPARSWVLVDWISAGKEPRSHDTDGFIDRRRHFLASL